jgi:hypothetical protein
MGGAESIVDNTYRWVEVLLIASAMTACLVPGQYRKAFPKRMPLSFISTGAVLLVVGCVLAPIFGESVFDAVLLRARFGFMVPDVHPHGYGWAFMFGYVIALVGAALLIIGGVMLRFGKVPPWISSDRKTDSENGRAT